MRLRNSRIITALAAVLALAVTGLLLVGPADASGAHPAKHLSAVEAAHVDAAKQAKSTFKCPAKTLCVHVYSLSGESWSWRYYYSCITHNLGPNYEVTWYVNNQTEGTRAEWYWADRDYYTLYTPGAYSHGRPKLVAPDASIVVCA